MKQYTVDVIGKSFCKKGEDICGDSFKVFRAPDSTVIVLSDGLGSGVKANVLSTLTVEIVGGLATGNLSTHEMVETLIATLPVCKWRGIAYSTFSILRIYDKGQATLVEYDSPVSLRLRGGERVSPALGSELEVLDKTIRESHFRLRPGDVFLQMSDGIIHAGVGTSLRMGWREEGVQSYLSHVAHLAEGQPGRLAEIVLRQAGELWESSPGDDGTVVATRYRKARNAVVITGPAGDSRDMPRMLSDFVSAPGIKVISGGTTSHLVAEKLGKDVDIDFAYIDSGLPPTAKIEGIDLVTEGMLTLNRVVDYMKHGVPDCEENAATKMQELLHSCDGITFMVGTARNAAHQNANFPPEMLLRRSVVETLAALLRDDGKTVEVNYY
ncbi:MAG: SpoIIE family protein phosphatase [Armatimonadota bacterium]|nr:serine/threonine-protein phosphatase [bacterium]